MPPSTLDPWLDANSHEYEEAEYRREVEGGMWLVAYALLAVALATLGTILWGFGYL